MSNALPFRDLVPGRAHVGITLDGEEMLLLEGANLAAALLAAGVTWLRRTPVSGARRAPYCMMGACYDCLVEIDGVTRQACMSEVQAGMAVLRPKGRPGDADH